MSDMVFGVSGLLATMTFVISAGPYMVLVK